MIRVFHAINGLGRGGAETLLSEGYRFADRERFELAYGYFFPWKDALVSSLTGSGAEVTCFDRRSQVGILRATGAMARKLEEWEADLVHAHLPLAGVVARRAARRVGIPCVYTEHNTLERYHAATRFLSKRTYPMQSAGIAVSEEVEASIRRHVADPGPLTVIPNGIDVDRFDPTIIDPVAARRTLGLPLDVPVVGTVAVFRVQKALEHWLTAAATIRQALPDTRFLIAGDGPLRDELNAQARSLGLEDAIIWTGLLEDVRPALAAMDLFLMSSRFEGLPLALLEAMAMEKLVVATDVGGVSQVLDSGVDGLVVGPEDPGALSSAVLGLLEGRHHRATMREAARKRAVTSFGMATMSRRIESVYRSVLRLNES